jgi:hypothetical protein
MMHQMQFCPFARAWRWCACYVKFHISVIAAGWILVTTIAAGIARVLRGQ